MEEVVGDATKSRIIAMAIDNLLAACLMLFVVAQVPAGYQSLRAVLFVVAYLSYFILFEGAWSRTPGKFFQGLVVRKLDGSPPGWRAAVIRGVSRVIEINPLLLGGLPAGLVVLGTKRKQRIGDLLAGTVVVPRKFQWQARISSNDSFAA
jgi:uncharacterized RDD family membrane protein YckC